MLHADAYWRKPLAWDAAAEKSGERHLVFCASMADVFEEWDGPIVDSTGRALFTTIRPSGRKFPEEAIGVFNNGISINECRPLTMDDVRLRLFDLIRKTPHLTWLVLTKRIDQVKSTLVRCMDLAGPIRAADDLAAWLADWLNLAPPENVWLGTSVEDQEWADRRVPELLKIPAKLRWLSVEPQLGPVDLKNWLKMPWMPDQIVKPYSVPVEYVEVRGIDWVICGGESGGKARPFELAWARSIAKQCRDADIPAFVKQLGANCHGYWLNPDGPGDGICHHSPDRGWKLKHPAGADPAEWPVDLRIQETPVTNPTNPARPAPV